MATRRALSIFIVVLSLGTSTFGLQLTALQTTSPDLAQHPADILPELLAASHLPCLPTLDYTKHPPAFPEDVAAQFPEAGSTVNCVESDQSLGPLLFTFTGGTQNLRFIDGENNCVVIFFSLVGVTAVDTLGFTYTVEEISLLVAANNELADAGPSTETAYTKLTATASQPSGLNASKAPLNGFSVLVTVRCPSETATDCKITSIGNPCPACARNGNC